MRDLRIGRAAAAAAVALALVLAACGGTGNGLQHDGASPPASASVPEFVAEAATYQIVVDRPGRLLLALLTMDRQWVSFGSAQVQFTFIDDGTGTPPPGVTMPAATAQFLPIPGSPPDTGQPMAITFPSDGHGLYAADDVVFPEAGIWQLLATGELADGTAVAATTFVQALSEPTVPWVGDEAIASDNAVIGDAGVPNSALDSRASGDSPIPDPELHQVSIADAMAAGRPALVVFSTPVYCVSQFCGPVTDVVAGLAAEYGDRADFIHVEIYRDFEADELNPAVLEWLVGPDGNFREPWVYLIDGDGTIIGSWDTMVTRDEIEPMLEALPAGS